jgi:plasmid stabilization system protein ParE
MKIRYSRRALSQLASMHDYLRERNRGTADTVAASIRATIGRLREMPFLGRRRTRAGSCDR